MIKPAIVAVGYNRPDSLERLLHSLNEAFYPDDDITLIISLDNSGVQKVVDVANDFQWNHGEKIVRTFEERQGLRKHIISCGDLSHQYGAVIILEDDLIVSKSFYSYTYQATNYYEHNEKICGVALYSHAWNGYAQLAFKPVQSEFDVYFGQFSITWGQCWNQRQWNNFKEWYISHEDQLPVENNDMPHQISRWSKQSWGKYFASYIVENDLFYVIPYCAMTTNFSEVGQHNSYVDSSHQVSLLQGYKEKFSFCNFDFGYKYDIFFDRIFDRELMNGIDGKDICNNLNLSKYHTQNKKYLLTTQKMDFPLVASFGMRMRPIDLNIDYNVPGNELLLYDIQNQSINLKVNFKKMSKVRINYELHLYYWKLLVAEGMDRLFMSIKKKTKQARRKK